ncbi:methyltransferase [bacterium LRH843]|nr:methyltransferase [bacterium LRH843]
MKEHYYEKLLNINTRGKQKEVTVSTHYFPYEPTPYADLEVLFSTYKLKNSDRIVDFGCGKGRLHFFINYFYDASVVGVEMNEILYQEAIENRNRYLKKMKKGKDKLHFHCCLAEEYPIDPLDNRFYFFNPFSIQIFRNIINNILSSVNQSKRNIELILYYGSEDYTYFLENDTSFELIEEIPLPFYERDSSERFLIYRLNF